MTNSFFFNPFSTYPDAVIVDAAQSKEYTYASFYTQIHSIASNIEKLNLTKHTVIVIYGYKNSFKPLLLFFACLKCNLIPFIVEAGNLSKITDLKFKGIIADEPIVEAITEKANYKMIGDTFNFYYDIYEDVYVGNENDLVIVSSSGSTSVVPKKILLGKEQTIANIKSNQEALLITHKDATLILLPISYSYGLIAQFLTHFFAGAKIVLGDRLLGLLQLPQLFKKYTISNVFMTPLLARLILYYYQNTVEIKNSLRFITMGGDKPHLQTLKKILSLFNCAVYGTYGLAEAGPRVATCKYTTASLHDEDLCIGDVNPGISLNIQTNKENNNWNNDEQAGYLEINSPSIYLGYIKGNRLDKPNSERVLLTKDICVKKDNRIFLLGREGDFIEYKNKVLWFNSLAKELYRSPEILKVKIAKAIDNKLEIQIFHRNSISIAEIKADLKNKYDLCDNNNYTMELVEFNNTHYK